MKKVWGWGRLCRSFLGELARRNAFGGIGGRALGKNERSKVGNGPAPPVSGTELTGIQGLILQKLSSDPPREVAEAKSRLAQVAEELAVVEDLGEGEGQDPDHG